MHCSGRRYLQNGSRTVCGGCISLARLLLGLANSVGPGYLQECLQVITSFLNGEV